MRLSKLKKITFLCKLHQLPTLNRQQSVLFFHIISAHALGTLFLFNYGDKDEYRSFRHRLSDIAPQNFK